LTSRGAVRDHYAHVSAVTPTVLDMLGIAPPSHVKGVPKDAFEGVSFAAALHDPDAERAKRTQFYAMMGTRGIWHDGWFANAVHPPTSAAPRGWSRFAQDRWELFHLDADRSQVDDLATAHPEKLEQLKALWHEQAVRFRGYPLNDRSVLELIARGDLAGTGGVQRTVYYPDTRRAHSDEWPHQGRSFALRAEVTVDAADAAAVSYSQGTRSAGQALYVHDGRLHYA
jgi:hypothetical protein